MNLIIRLLLLLLLLRRRPGLVQATTHGISAYYLHGFLCCCACVDCFCYCVYLLLMLLLATVCLMLLLLLLCVYCYCWFLLLCEFTATEPIATTLPRCYYRRFNLCTNTFPCFELYWKLSVLLKLLC